MGYGSGHIFGLIKERQYFNQLNNAVDSAELTPLQKSFLIGATNRIQPHLRQGEEFQKILKEALKEAEEVYNHAMRKWRMQQTVIDPVRGRIKVRFRLFLMTNEIFYRRQKV